MLKSLSTMLIQQSMKANETKEQRKLRKQQEKSTSPVATTAKRYVVCLKYGNKYSSEYVNRLYQMVKRNLTLDYEFVCFTEDPKGIDNHITIRALPIQSGIQGWWYKPFFFNPNLGLDATTLFLDLDMIVFNNIDNLFTYKPGEFLIIRDFNRILVKNYQKFNSSVFRLEPAQHSQVYREFIKNPQQIMRRFPGDQDWIRHQVTDNFSYWPDEWIQSYKWEMRGKPQMDRAQRGERDFLVTGDPTIKPTTSIAVFHGDPNPHNCKDRWCQENWR